MSLVYYNGQFIPREEMKIDFTNRAFRYADGCFESISVINGVPAFWSLHWQRLTETLEWLDQELEIDELSLKNDVSNLLKNNDVKSDGWLRIMLFREGGGTYFPEQNKAGVIIECGYSNAKTFSQIALKTGGVFERITLPKGEVGNYKTVNKTIHVLAAKHAQKNNWQDAVLLNGEGEVAEAISSNVYLVFGDEVITPELTSGCLNGTIRKVLSQGFELTIKLKESRIDRVDLDRADEIWTSNARTGISAFSTFNGRELRHAKAEQMQQALGQLAINSLKDFPES